MKSSKEDTASSLSINHKTEQQRCVYGYVGRTFDDAIKPLLLLYLVGSAFGMTILPVLCHSDTSRSFVMSTGLHAFPEVLVWTHLLFPPLTAARWRNTARYVVRSVYGVAWLFLAFGPTSLSGKISPVMVLTYLMVAATSDCLGLWLGMLMMVCRKHHGVRRLGVSFFVHGFAFHVVMYETFAQGDALGMDRLRGYGWIILLTASIFKEPLDIRDQAPGLGEMQYLVAGVLVSLLGLPLLASHGRLPDVMGVLENPALLPRDPFVLLAYKMIFPIVGLAYVTRVVTVYVDEGLPILPLSKSTNSTHGSLSISTAKNL